ncbi:DUF3427 domain-containing protein [Glaciecola sp. MF2-115]|uniref:DUF3427 domain-containing protein n=1 Tax=Glaciecola sp. MF2-115 TaxID=3384827 RepID=UPI0039A14685
MVQESRKQYQFALDPVYEDKFVTNSVNPRKRVLTEIKHALLEADSFDTAIAFITKSGVMSLYQALEEFGERGCKVRIVASDYLNFTQPEALDSLRKIPGVEVRLLQGKQYHGKLYIFNKGDNSKVMVGSSNLTQSALSSNEEINFLYSKGAERIRQAKFQFEQIWSNSVVVDGKVLEQYQKQYDKHQARNPKNVFQLESFTPNELQELALENLRKSRLSGKKRGLVVSATGTGKTVLSAFDVRQTKAKSALFLVHRTNIASKSMQTYQTILKDEYSFGLVGGKANEWGADFLFGTVQTIARPENLKRLDSRQFDYIVIDETHRASAASYQRIIEHFEPKFLLGMTATPERSDSQDIFSIFDNNIVCDIRLQDALETDILCPFHYFGIADLSHVESDDLSLAQLTRDQRFEHILTQSEKLGADSTPIKALCFLSRVEEANRFAEYLISKGLSAVALSGNNSEVEKQQAIKKLENGELQYIITVDIFNEGIDIPSINQIVMARPTQSAIIFVQQLGRGLRKADNKEYLTVIDIVGNYDNNFLIPIALYGDRSRNKDTLRRLLRSEETLLPGESTISFDRIAKERIFKAIQTSPKIGIRELKTEYALVKAKTGKTPTLMALRKHGDLSPLMFCRQSKINSLHDFALKYDKEYSHNHLGEFPLLGLLVKEALDGVQAFEPIALKLLIQGKTLRYETFKQACNQQFGIATSEKNFKDCLRVLNLEFGQPNGYSEFQVVDLDSNSLGRDIDKFDVTQKALLNDAIENALSEFEVRQSIGRFNDGFVVGAKYTYKETFRILGWSKNPNPQNIGGYSYNRETNDCAIFVNYNKDESISASTQYHDVFLSRSRFHWTTKNKRSLNSPEVRALLNQNVNNLRVPLFIRKEAASEGSARYYIGEMSAIKGSEKETMVGGQKAVSIDFELDQPVPQKLYQHLVNKV